MLLYRNLLKPLADLMAAILLIVLFSPLILIVFVLLAIANSGHPFFFQRRPGKDERIFTIIKFKTMNDKTDREGNLLPDAERLTAVGQFVRRTSLDELPQLFNVLKGEMSLVGPRPLRVYYLKRYNDFQKRRHEVKPGITGLAQVKGRNAISWEEKFKYDVWYVDNQSFWEDLKILWLTGLKVIRSEGISSASSATMEEFKG
jgi:lipopolysaccharide/colanic/teichoic acid biosynthesis glycosyltransferase